jgi:hypothetical protein
MHITAAMCPSCFGMTCFFEAATHEYYPNTMQVWCTDLRTQTATEQCLVIRARADTYLKVLRKAHIVKRERRAIHPASTHAFILCYGALNILCKVPFPAASCSGSCRQEISQPGSSHASTLFCEVEMKYCPLQNTMQ